MKITPVITVRRSRLRSTTVEPAMEPPSWPPPNMSDRPPPRPECSRIRKISVSADEHVDDDQNDVEHFAVSV